MFLRSGTTQYEMQLWNLFKMNLLSVKNVSTYNEAAKKKIDYMASHILTSCQLINLFTERSVLYIMTAVWMKSTSVCSVCTETSGSVFMWLLKVCFLEEDDASVSSMSLRLLSSIRHPYLFMHRKHHHLSRFVLTESFIMVHGDVETWGLSLSS